jgi:hypothetical protein
MEQLCAFPFDYGSGYIIMKVTGRGILKIFTWGRGGVSSP